MDGIVRQIDHVARHFHDHKGTLYYLTALCQLLPGSKELLTHWFANRQRLALAISMAAGIAFVGFHLALMAMGPFFDRFYTK